MSTSTRVTRSKGESDGLSLPTRTRPNMKDATSGRSEGDRDQQQQIPAQSPLATATERMETTSPMLPPGPHRPLTPRVSPPASPIPSSISSVPLFKEDNYSSTSEEESEVEAEVTFLHDRSRISGKFTNNQTVNSMPRLATSDYMTQGDPDASPVTSNEFWSTQHNEFLNTQHNKFLSTNNFFMPDGSDRRIHQIPNKVFQAGYLENGNNAYLLELPALEKMLNTHKFLMDEMSGQFYAVYGNSYQQMSTKPRLQQTWATGDLIDELVATRQAFGYTGLAGPTPPLAAGTQPMPSMSHQQDDLLPTNQHLRRYSINPHHSN